MFVRCKFYRHRGDRVGHDGILHNETPAGLWTLRCHCCGVDWPLRMFDEIALIEEGEADED